MPLYITCSICLEPIIRDSGDPCMLTCGHLYHEDCVSHWQNLNPNASCPVCRIGVCNAKIKVFLTWDKIDDENEEKLKKLKEDFSTLSREHEDTALASLTSKKEVEYLKTLVKKISKKNCLSEKKLCKQTSQINSLKKALVEERRKLNLQNEKLEEMERYFKTLIHITESSDLDIDIDQSMLNNKEAVVACIRASHLNITKLKAEMGQMKNELAEYREKEKRMQTLIGTLSSPSNQKLNEKTYKQKYLNVLRQLEIELCQMRQVHSRILGADNGNTDSNTGLASTSGEGSAAPVFSGILRAENGNSDSNPGLASTSGEESVAPVFSGIFRAENGNSDSNPGPTISSRKGRAAGLRPCKVVLKKLKHF